MRGMKQLMLLLATFVACSLQPCLADTATSPPAAPAPVSSAATVQVRVVTNMGNILIELNAERAPLSVAHFLKYVDQGHYNGTIFHRGLRRRLQAEACAVQGGQ
jgi:hypothetical protein